MEREALWEAESKSSKGTKCRKRSETGDGGACDVTRSFFDLINAARCSGGKYLTQRRRPKGGRLSRILRYAGDTLLIADSKEKTSE